MHPRRRPSVHVTESAVLAGLVGRLRCELVLAGVVGGQWGVDAVSDEVAADEGEYELVCTLSLSLSLSLQIYDMSADPRSGSVVIAGIFVVIILLWVVDRRKKFAGPKIDWEALNAKNAMR